MAAADSSPGGPCQIGIESVDQAVWGQKQFQCVEGSINRSSAAPYGYYDCLNPDGCATDVIALNNCVFGGKCMNPPPPPPTPPPPSPPWPPQTPGLHCRVREQ